MYNLFFYFIFFIKPLVRIRIIDNVQVQQFPQCTRHSAFSLFSNLISRHAAALKSFNNEFVYGFTQILDGEKDPRNLMSAFQIMTSIVQNFDISAHVEVCHYAEIDLQT